MNICGIGTVFARGRGVARLEEALTKGWIPPSLVDLSFFRATGFPLYRVPDEALADKALSRKLRRADRLAKIAVVAAADALDDSALTISDPAGFGIILATALGPHATTFKFLDDIIDYGDTSVSPTAFSHSVHNAAASYIASVLGIRGPAMTLTHFHFAFQEAVRLAGTWLAEGRCDHVLVGSADECGVVMEYIASRKLRIAMDGRIYPFLLGPSPPTVPGEGSAFFVLSNKPAAAGYCTISVTTRNDPAGDVDVQVIGADGMAPDESAYLQTLNRDLPVTACSPLFGGLMTGSALDCAAAALMIRNRSACAPPVADNPHSLKLCTDTTPAPDSVACIKCDCSGKSTILRLSRHPGGTQ